MRKELKFIFISLVCSFFKNNVFSTKKFNNQKKIQKLFQKKLLINLFKKFEEYINETSFELW